MPETAPSPPPLITARGDQIFPKLSDALIARLAARGRARQMREGEILVEAGDQIVNFFVIKSGEVEIVRPCLQGDTLVGILEAGQFTGEVSLISGRHALLRLRSRSPGEAIE